MSVNAATLAGCAAILLWSTLALLGAGATRIPPLQLLALCFAVASALGLAYAGIRRVNLLRAALAHRAALLLTTAALGAFHYFYFFALAHAPVVDASLIAYLWPVLIVVFAGVFGGARVTRWHLAGTALGLAGAGIVITSRGALAASPHYLLGYGAALACAFIWSGYSVANRRHADAPTALVALACVVVMLAALVAHVLFETTVRPSRREWQAILLLGAGPELDMPRGRRPPMAAETAGATGGCAPRREFGLSRKPDARVPAAHLDRRLERRRRIRAHRAQRGHRARPH